MKVSKEELERLKKLVDRADSFLREAQVCIDQAKTILKKKHERKRLGKSEAER